MRLIYKQSRESLSMCTCIKLIKPFILLEAWVYMPAHMEKSISHKVSHWKLLQAASHTELYCSTTGVAINCMKSGHIENNNKRQANASCTFGEVKSNGILWHSVWCNMHAVFAVDLLQNLNKVYDNCHSPVFCCGTIILCSEWSVSKKL